MTIVPGDRDDTGAGLPDGLVELPSGALLVLCEGVTATSLSAAFERPVIVADRVLDPAAATAIAIAASDGCPPAAAAEAVGLLQAAGLDVYLIDDTPGLIVTRTVAMLANLAADALACGVATEPDIDNAMRLGVNYPLGPLAWARQWGTGTVLRILDSLDELVPRRPLPPEPPAAPHRARPPRVHRGHRPLPLTRFRRGRQPGGGTMSPSRSATRAPSAGSASTARTSATPSTRQRATPCPPPWTTRARGPAC